MSQDQFDHFSDILQQNKGIFGSETGGLDDALSEVESVQTVAAPDGVHITLRCVPVAGENHIGCGATRDLTIEWPELVCLATGISPHNVFQGGGAFEYSPRMRAWRPTDVRCNCGNRLFPYVTGEEAQSHVRGGRASRYPWFQSQGFDQVYKTASQMVASAARGG